jgi:hypothetical protein
VACFSSRSSFQWFYRFPPAIAIPFGHFFIETLKARSCASEEVRRKIISNPIGNPMAGAAGWSLDEGQAEV